MHSLRERLATADPDVMDVYPLSPMQQGMLFNSLSAPSSGVDIMQYLFRFDEAVDTSAMEAAWRSAIRRHSVLRTRIRWEDLDTPVQEVMGGTAFELWRLDWSGAGPVEQEQQYEAFVEEERRRGVELDRAPLFRVAWIRFDDTSYRLVWTVHHIILDGPAVIAVLDEVFQTYDELRRGQSSKRKPARQYREYVDWMERQDWSSAEAFWLKRLKGVEGPTPLPQVRVEPGRSGFTFIESRLPADVTARLRSLCGSLRMTMNTVVQGAWGLLLARYSGLPDVVFGATRTCRRSALGSPGVPADMMGLFLNTVPVRIRIEAARPVCDWLLEIRQYWMDLRDFENIPLSRAQACAPLTPGTPLFDSHVLFDHQQVPTALAGMPAFAGRPCILKHQSYFPFSLNAYDEDTLTFRIKYDRSRYDERFVERALTHLSTIFQGIADHPAGRLRDIPTLDVRERHLILDDWNSERLIVDSDRTLVGLFEAEASRQPHGVAVVHEATALTWSDLSSRVGLLARFLSDRGVGTGGFAAVCLERTPELVVAVLAVMKAGAAYVAMYPDAPPERLAFMASDAGARCILTSGKLRSRMPAGFDVIAVDEDWPQIEATRAPKALPVARSSDAAYVIYTSGTTGKPKGVLMEHAPVINYVRAVCSRVGLERGATFAMVQPLSVDSSVTVLYGSLLTGGTLHLISEARSVDPEAMAAYFAANVIDCLKIAPSHLAALQSGLANPAALMPRRWLIVGGEDSRRDWVDRLRTMAPNCRVFNHYGPTEAAVGMLAYPVRDDDHFRRGVLPLGKPFANTQAYVLDADMMPVPAGIPGELYIGGDCLARGYLGRPELTAEKFVPDPFRGSGSRLYRSGDLVRHLPDGSIEFLGRVDHQVKIRGFRIELGEIESVLRQQAMVRECLVIAREDQPGDKRLVTYLTGAPGSRIAEDALRDALALVLPEYMVPSAFVILDTMPLTPHGKIDRQKLPAPQAQGKTDRGGTRRTPAEEIICGIWCELFGRDRVELDDNFFALGGHSLMATRCVSRVRQAFGVDVPITIVFDAPTPAGMARIVDTLSGSGQSRAEPLIRVDRASRLPISFAQHRMWFMSRMESGTATYNVPVVIGLRGNLDVPALRFAIEGLAGRHEILRTRYVSEDGEPVAIIDPVAAVEWSDVDLSGLDHGERQAAVRQQMLSEVTRPFDLETGPMLRARLVKTGTAEHRLLLTLHHIVSDGWSVGVMQRDLAALYDAGVSGSSVLLPELPVQYADYSGWLRRWFQGDVIEEQRSYWKAQLAGIPGLLELPTDRPRPAERSFQGACEDSVLPPDLLQAVERLSRKNDVTLFVTLMSAFLVLLGRISRKNDVFVGTDVANRRRVEVENLIGCFLNLLVIRTDLGGNPTFRDVLGRVRKTMTGAYAHQDLPFEMLVDEVRPERTAAHMPLVQVLFVQQEVKQTRSGGGVTWTLLDPEYPWEKFDLAVFAEHRGEDLRLRWRYSTDLFDAGTIRHMAASFEHIVRTVTDRPETFVEDLATVSELERRKKVMENKALQAERVSKLGNFRRKGIDLAQVELVKTETINGNPTPLVIRPTTEDLDPFDWAAGNRDFVLQKLSEHGALLFRGFALNSGLDFERFAGTVCSPLFGEYGDLPPDESASKIYHSTPYPDDKTILFHNEASHTHRWPMKQFFYCVKPSETGGNTPLVDCRKVYNRLDPAIIKNFKEKKLSYLRNFSPGLDVRWQDFFKTNDRAEVEAFCHKAGATCVWHDNENLTTKQLCHGVMQHPRTGEWSFFNQVQLHHISCLDAATRDALLQIFPEDRLPRNVCYGDNTPIEDSVMAEIDAAYWELSVSNPWQARDVIMLDNMLIAHARNPFTGTRKILVAMGEMVNRADLNQN